MMAPQPAIQRAGSGLGIGRSAIKSIPKLAPCLQNCGFWGYMHRHH
jgi:hypothetical protein